MIMIIVN